MAESSIYPIPKLHTPAEIAAIFCTSERALIRFARKHRVPIIEMKRGRHLFTEAAILELYRLKGMQPPAPPPPIAADPPPVVLSKKFDIRELAVVTLDDVIYRSQEWTALSAVYFLIKDGRVAYVGQSINVHQRLDEHRKKKSYDRFFILPCEPVHLRALEAFYINEFRPEDNMDTTSLRFRGLKQNNHWMEIHVHAQRPMSASADQPAIDTEKSRPLPNAP
jgi:hypothetical protein